MVAGNEESVVGINDISVEESFRHLRMILKQSLKHLRGILVTSVKKMEDW